MNKTNPSNHTLTQLPLVSLMQPAGKPADVRQEPSWGQDLRLDKLAEAFGTLPRHTPFIRQTLAALNTDPDTIAWRQAILRDFLLNTTLVERLNKLLSRLTDLRLGRPQLGKYQRNILLETSDRLAELNTYVDIVQELYSALQDTDVQAEALRQLRDNLRTLVEDELFKTLKDTLPELQSPLQNFTSLTVGVNLDAQLRPASAVLLGVNEKHFGGVRSFLGKLFAVDQLEGDVMGVAQLHHIPSDPERRPLSPLFQDLDRLIVQIVQPITKALNRFTQISVGPVIGRENEIAFSVAASRLIRRLESQGILFCQPEIAPMAERVTHIENLVNLQLVLRETKGTVVPVGNDVNFDDQGRIAILTGPNSGGKTTYVQAVGLAQVLFQAGLFIPARKARISPVDAIFTHFPAVESFQGRFSEEAARLHVLCLNATEYSLTLLNESLASTTASEGLYVAQELLSGLRYIGVRAIYATHLVELAERIHEIEAAVDGKSAVFSLVAGLQLVEDPATGDLRAAPTYHIAPGLPQGRGYAQEIARRYGISLEQIVQARRDADAHSNGGAMRSVPGADNENNANITHEPKADRRD